MISAPRSPPPASSSSPAPNWPDQLAALFEKYPGLPLPQQFLRTSLLDDCRNVRPVDRGPENHLDRNIAPIRKNGRDYLPRRQSPTRTGRIVVLAGSQFNLADLSNIALRHALPEDNRLFVAFDPDHPLTAGPLPWPKPPPMPTPWSPPIYSAPICRTSSPRRTAWITWITTGRITAPDTQGSRDGLLLADPAWRQDAHQRRLARRAHPDRRLAANRSPASSARNLPPVLGLLTDTRTIEIPPQVKDFSSQHLLWEFIEDELTRDPLALGDDPDRYLNSRMSRFNIRDEKFDRGLFFDRLIAPAYKRGVALFLLKNGIRVALFGRGWNEMAEFKSCAMGPIENLADLTHAISQCDAILQPIPIEASRPPACRCQ